MNRAKSHTVEDGGGVVGDSDHWTIRIQWTCGSINHSELSSPCARALCHCHIDSAMWTHKRIELSKSSDIIVKFQHWCQMDQLGLAFSFVVHSQFRRNLKLIFIHSPTNTWREKIIIIWLIICTMYTSFHFAYKQNIFGLAMWMLSLFPIWPLKVQLFMRFFEEPQEHRNVQFWRPLTKTNSVSDKHHISIQFCFQSLSPIWSNFARLTFQSLAYVYVYTTVN